MSKWVKISVIKACFSKQAKKDPVHFLTCPWKALLGKALPRITGFVNNIYSVVLFGQRSLSIYNLASSLWKEQKECFLGSTLSARGQLPVWPLKSSSARPRSSLSPLSTKPRSLFVLDLSFLLFLWPCHSHSSNIYEAPIVCRTPDYAFEPSVIFYLICSWVYNLDFLNKIVSS